MRRVGRPSTHSKHWHQLDNFHISLPSSHQVPKDIEHVISSDCRRVSSKSKDAAELPARAPTPTSTIHPLSLDDSLSGWNPCDPSSSNDDAPAEEKDIEQTGEKRKRYRSTDDPMGVWLPYMELFLDELLRGEGLGNSFHQPACSICCQAYSVDGHTRLFRCRDCYGGLMCEDCLLTRHVQVPLHVVEEWSEGYWQRRTLYELGLVYSLDHDLSTCPGQDRPRDLVVIDITGFHKVRICYCTCRATHAASNLEQLLRTGWYPATVTDPHTCATFRVLDLFRLLNVIANVNVETFCKTLSNLTDPCALAGLPDRSVLFGRMERQYAFLTRVKRSGRPYRTSYPGDLAISCWGCPNEELNLPPDWRKAAPEFQFLYMLIIALDANFRLKNRIRSNERGHATLGPGSSYFVDPQPYKEHLKNYVAEEDVSTCIAFAALLKKETKITTGLRTSGVAGVVCARHELVRPLGIGDLQKGERYANVDYVLLSALQDVKLDRVTISYDIACQWQINLKQRITQLPPHLSFPPSLRVQFGVPTWHAAVHELSCRMKNSLTYQDGVGHTDGEGIERTWSALNSAAWSTKEMGEGARHDHLDDKVDHHNFVKNLSHRELLPRRLLIAREEYARQLANYEMTTSTLKPEVHAAWQALIDAWALDKNGPSPYRLCGQEKNPTEAQVRKDLKEEEAREAAAGNLPIHGTSAAAFLALGLSIESMQQKVLAASSLSGLTLAVEGQVHQCRLGILTKLKTYRDLQRIYAPGAIRALQRDEESRPLDATPLAAECIKLYLPSDLSPSDRRSGLSTGLVAAKLVCAEPNHLIAWRDDNAVGQQVATRSRTLIDSVSDKVHSSAEKYRRSREALIALVGDGQYPELRPLLDEDLTSDIVVEDDALAQRRLASVSKHKRKRNTYQPTGTRTISWIWTAHLGTEDARNGLDDSVRVNWSKSQLRVKRWKEEVQVLEEEMRRVLRSQLTLKKRWKNFSKGLGIPDDAVSQGRQAYALKQAHMYERLYTMFFSWWSSPHPKTEIVTATASDLTVNSVPLYAQSSVV